MYKTNYVSSYETMVYFAKGYPPFHYTRMEEMHNVWRFPIPSNTERIKGKDGETLHPTQKPVALINKILQDATNSDSVVCDPFGGLATVNAVCAMKGLTCIGMELNPEFYTAGKMRLAKIGNIGSRQLTLLD